MAYHEPVMVREVADNLVTDLAGLYLDATAGGGGHSEALLASLNPGARLVAVDRDLEAVATTGARLSKFGGRATVLQGSFSQLRSLLSDRMASGSGLSGALFDLGVSSRQIDVASRGFSYHQDGPLDMRMDRSSGVPAADLVARMSEADLVSIIKRYGEERQARRIVREICRVRDETGLSTTGELKAAVTATRPQNPSKTLARVFQALRIEVNEELAELDGGLDAVVEMLKSGGRVAVISYHSLEDRLVKRTLAELTRGCICPPRIPVCACGRSPTFRAVCRRPLRASDHEVESNSRARSAIMRIFEKV